MNPKQLNGIPARLPLKPGPNGRAVDALGAPVFDNGRVSAPLDWEDVMNDPAWGPKGYPTAINGGGGGGASTSHATGWGGGGGGGGGVVYGHTHVVGGSGGYARGVIPDDAPDTVRLPARAAAKCECGAEKTYGVGATHSSWCAKAGAP